MTFLSHKKKIKPNPNDRDIVYAYDTAFASSNYQIV